MLNKRDLARLHVLQAHFAMRRDWIAVGHLQALIDHVPFEGVDLSECARLEGTEVRLH